MLRDRVTDMFRKAREEINAQIVAGTCVSDVLDEKDSRSHILKSVQDEYAERDAHTMLEWSTQNPIQACASAQHFVQPYVRRCIRDDITHLVHNNGILGILDKLEGYWMRKYDDIYHNTDTLMPEIVTNLQKAAYLTMVNYALKKLLRAVRDATVAHVGYITYMETCTDIADMCERMTAHSDDVDVRVSRQSGVNKFRIIKYPYGWNIHSEGFDARVLVEVDGTIEVVVSRSTSVYELKFFAERLCSAQKRIMYENNILGHILQELVHRTKCEEGETIYGRMGDEYATVNIVSSNSYLLTLGSETYMVRRDGERWYCSKKVDGSIVIKLVRWVCNK